MHGKSIPLARVYWIWMILDNLLQSKQKTVQIYYTYKQFIYKMESKHQMSFTFNAIMPKEGICHALDAKMIYSYLRLRWYHLKDQTTTWVWVLNLLSVHWTVRRWWWNLVDSKVLTVYLQWCVPTIKSNHCVLHDNTFFMRSHYFLSTAIKIEMTKFGHNLQQDLILPNISFNVFYI